MSSGLRSGATIIAMSVVRVFGALCTLGTLTTLLLSRQTPLAAGDTVSQPAAASASRHLVLGMVRNDGVLLPFAAFDGRKWSAPWPFIDRFGGVPELPVNLASVPLDWWGGEAPGAWRLWSRSGEPRALALSSLVMVRVGQSRQLA